jgi:hypothetical protein
MQVWQLELVEGEEEGDEFTGVLVSMVFFDLILFLYVEVWQLELVEGEEEGDEFTDVLVLDLVIFSLTVSLCGGVAAGADRGGGGGG